MRKSIPPIEQMRNKIIELNKNNISFNQEYNITISSLKKGQLDLLEEIKVLKDAIEKLNITIEKLNK